MIRFECQCCEQPIEIDMSEMGAKVMCPSCNQRITVIPPYRPQSFGVPSNCESCAANDFKKVSLVWQQQSERGTLNAAINAAMRFNTFGINSAGGASIGIWNIPFNGKIAGETSNGSLLSYTLAPPTPPITPAEPRNYHYSDPPPLPIAPRVGFKRNWIFLVPPVVLGCIFALCATIFCAAVFGSETPEHLRDLGFSPVDVERIVAEKPTRTQNRILLYATVVSGITVPVLFVIFALSKKRRVILNRSDVYAGIRLFEDYRQWHSARVAALDELWAEYDEQVEESKRQFDCWNNAWICMKCGSIAFRLGEE